MIVIGFVLKIENMIESEFLNVMPIALAKKLLLAFGLHDEQDGVDEHNSNSDRDDTTGDTSGVMSQSEIEKLLGNAPKQAPKAPESHESSGVPPKRLTQEEIEKLLMQNAGEDQEAQRKKQGAEDSMGERNKETSLSAQQSMDMQQQMLQQMQLMMQQMMQKQQMPPQDPKLIHVKPLVHHNLNDAVNQLGEEQAENLALIMEVPLEISVEIGRTKRMVKDILELVQGSLVVLDKLAGEQVDLFVNGQCIAKGDVVVVDDNFGVRITEIIKKN